jgi:hypothetical protein
VRRLVGFGRAAARLTALAVLILASAPPAWAGRTDLNPPAIGGIPECKDSRVVCVGTHAGAEARYICNKSCTNEAAPCADGSAIKTLADSGVCTSAAPCTIRVAPGLYEECLANDTSYIAFEGSARKSILRPPVDSYEDVASAVFVLAGQVNSANNTQGVTVRGFTIVNHAFDFKAAALSVGYTNFATSVGSFNNILITDNTLVGNYAALRVTGRGVNGSAFQGGALTVRGNTLVAGAEGVYDEGYFDGTIAGNDFKTITDYCEGAAVVTSSATRAVEAGANTTTTVQFTGLNNSTFTTNDVRVGLRLTFVDGAGTCPVATGTEAWITDYVGGGTTGNIATFAPAVGVAPDPNCSVTIAPVGGTTNAVSANSNPDICGGADWGIIRANQPLYFGYSDISCYHFDFASGDSASSPNDVRRFGGGNTCKIEVNDFGINLTDSSANCTGRGKVAGILYDFAPRRLITFDEPFSPQIDINVDLPDNSLCPDILGGVIAAGQCEIEDAFNFQGDVTIRNPGRAGAVGDNDVNIFGVVSGCTVGGTKAVNVTRSHMSFTSTASGWTGAATHLKQKSNGVLNRGAVTANATIVTSGTIGLLPGAAATGSATLDFASITSDCVEVVNGGGAATLTVPGAAAGDSCAVGVPTAANVLKSSWTCRVSAANTVTVRHCCNNGTCDPASGTFTATVKRQ